VTTLLRQTPPLLHTMSTIAASLQRVMPIATQGTSPQIDTSIKTDITPPQSAMYVTTHRFKAT